MFRINREKALLAMTLGVLLACPIQAFALDKINKKLKLKENYSHLLYFDEKILRYELGDEKAFEVEILPNIYNTKNEMLIRPRQKAKTNLMVWTKEKIYNFDINVKGINKGYEGFDYFEIDLPPGLE